MGAIAGGAVGGFAAALVVALVLIYFLRRRNRRRAWYRDDRVGAIDEDVGDSEYAARAIRPNVLLEHHQPGLRVPDSEQEGLELDSASGRYTPLGTGSDSSGGEPSLVQSGGKRRGGASSTTRVVNYVQHDDAGPSEPVLELETIEMPPAYADLRRGKVEGGSNEHVKGPSDDK